MNRIGSKKWNQKANDLFQFYLKLMKQEGLESSDICAPRYSQMVKDMMDMGVRTPEIMEFIEFSVKNWQFLRDLDKDGRYLSEIPSFYEMFARWRFPKWVKLMRDQPKQQELHTWIKKI